MKVVTLILLLSINPQYEDNFTTEYQFNNLLKEEKISYISDYILSYVNNEKHAKMIAKSAVKYSEQFDLDLLTVLSIIKVESTFKPNLVSSANARGLMQVVPKWHKKKLTKINDLFDIDDNIYIGCWILSEYIQNSNNMKAALKKYSGNTPNYFSRIERNRNKIIDHISKTFL